MPKRMAYRIVTLALLILSASCGGLPTWIRRDAASARTAAALHHAKSSGTRAGAIAQSSDHELGIVAAARISPDGHWMVVVDEVPPNVKVVDPSGVVTAALHFDHDTAARYVPPIVAISNTLLLVVRPDLRRVELFDHLGNRISTMGGVDFIPLAATAISDSTWLVYGPSRRANDGTVEWVHCLYLTGRDAPRWRSAFRDSVRRTPSRLAVPVLTESRAGVLITHDNATSDLLTANCGDGSATPAVAVGARDGAEKVASHARDGFGVVDLGGALATTGVQYRKPRWASVFRSKGDEVSTVFELFDAGTESRRVIVPGKYQMMDERGGVGVLFAVDEPVPQLFLLDNNALRVALKGQP